MLNIIPEVGLWALQMLYLYVENFFPVFLNSHIKILKQSYYEQNFIIYALVADGIGHVVCR